MHVAIKVALAGSIGLSFVPATRALAQHDMSRMEGPAAALPLGIPLSRLGSGTSWVPDATPMRAFHGSLAAWTLMVHGAMFGQYDRQEGLRGDQQVGLVDWEMLMAARSVAGGLLRLNVMTSLQPLVTGDSGYPELLQTGGVTGRTRLVNRQHPHNLIGELAATYDRSLTSNLATSLYVAAVGEPAIGPVAYMHRPSGADDPFAPIGHHWQDATHESRGVATLGLYTRRVKVEGSAFNGRDSDEYLSLDYTGARLDSYSGRVSLAPTPNVTMSAWAAYVYAHDPLEVPIGMQRYGVSFLNVNRAPNGRTISTGLVYGINVHHHGSREHNHDDPTAKTYNLSPALALESSVDVTSRATVFGRIEEVDKTADDLGFQGGDLTQTFMIRAISLGGAYRVTSFRGAALSVGARGTVNLLPEDLRLTYQTTRPVGFSVYLRLRPDVLP